MMNERIKELIKQATTEEHDGFLYFDKKKFAELLIKAAGEHLMSPEFIGRRDLDWSMVLNEYFGVEK